MSLPNRLLFLMLLLFPSVGVCQVTSSSYFNQESSERLINTEGDAEKSFLDSSDNSYWANLGLGLSSRFASFSYQIPNHLFSLRYSFDSKFLGSEEDWDVGLLYGKVLTNGKIYTAFSAGLSVVGEGFGSEPDQETSYTGGIPLEGQIFWRPSKVVGFGLYGFANINPQHSFAGLALSFQFGKL